MERNTRRQGVSMPTDPDGVDNADRQPHRRVSMPADPERGWQHEHVAVLSSMSEPFYAFLPQMGLANTDAVSCSRPSMPSDPTGVGKSLVFYAEVAVVSMPSYPERG
jgi:hypothetical protein